LRNNPLRQLHRTRFANNMSHTVRIISWISIEYSNEYWHESGV